MIIFIVTLRLLTNLIYLDKGKCQHQDSSGLVVKVSTSQTRDHRFKPMFPHMIPVLVSSRKVILF
jgi:hypothetical protein